MRRNIVSFGVGVLSTERQRRKSFPINFNIAVAHGVLSPTRGDNTADFVDCAVTRQISIVYNGASDALRGRDDSRAQC